MYHHAVENYHVDLLNRTDLSKRPRKSIKKDVATLAKPGEVTHVNWCLEKMVKSSLASKVFRSSYVVISESTGMLVTVIRFAHIKIS